MKNWKKRGAIVVGGLAVVGIAAALVLNALNSNIALYVTPSEVAAGNVTDICLNADCSAMRPIRSLKDLRMPGGALGDFFGAGTTVGVPFSAQLGIRFSF